MKGLVMRSIVMLFSVLIAKTLTERIDLNMKTMMHTWLREFSRRHVMTSIITFTHLAANKKYRNIVQPLIVILLDSKKTIKEFANITRSKTHLKYDTYPIWLYLFLQLPGYSFKASCRYPTDNIFNVKFDTRMLVLCYDQPILTEWYAVSDNRTRTFELATWSANQGIILKTQKSLYNRRVDLFGEVLRVASVHESPFISLENGTIGGFFGSLLLELSKLMDFKIQLLDPVNSYGSWNHQNGLWSGVIGQLISDQADIGVGEFSMTSHRQDVVKFMLPLIQSRHYLYIRQPDGSEMYWLGYLKTFTFGVWTMILIVIICSPILLAIIKAKKHISMNLIMENYLNVWGIFCQQGLSEFPNGTPMRLALFSIFVSSLIIQAAYSASFISFLTLPRARLPFSTIEGYIADGTYKLIVMNNTSEYDMFNYAENPTFLKMRKLMMDQQLPLTAAEGFKQICEKGNLAFYVAETEKNAVELQCKILFIETGNTDSMGMILRKGSPYSGLMNHHIRRILNNGVIHRLKKKYLSKTNPLEDKFKEVDLWSIAPILAVMATGIVLGIFILILEKAYCIFKNKPKNNIIKKPNPKFNIKQQRRNVKKNITFQSHYGMNYGRPIGYWP